MATAYKTRVRNRFTGVEGGATFDEVKNLWSVLLDGRQRAEYYLDNALEFL